MNWLEGDFVTGPTMPVEGHGLTLQKMLAAVEDLIEFNIYLNKKDADKLGVRHGQINFPNRFWVSKWMKQGEAWKVKNEKYLEKLKVWDKWNTEQEIKALEKKLKGLKT